MEILLGIYFAAATLYAIQMENYATIPFLMLFVWGYLYTGVMSLGQVFFERLRLGARAEIADSRPAAAPVSPGV